MDDEGPLTLLELDQGLVILPREQLKAKVRNDLAGDSLVDQLFADRAAEVAADPTNERD